ncbi:MAG: diaminohydroxyphosphoribosylaminopyrimidine deaminase [Planctomycetota bacterium]|jgi:diaminohydroxyphosphoribosylaminopyrimidine deaminase/5-amino-6-(5-phosphoribosylamino)uracil reductase
MSSTTVHLDSTAILELLKVLGTEASEHRFEVAPNPCVGAAVLALGQEVAKGFHEQWGGPHAEIMALKAAAKAAAEGGLAQSTWDTLVVTLEPCSTRGKTPPCVEAILASGIRTVVVGALDPDPRHKGRGIEMLREAGLEVILVEGRSRLEEVAPHFLRWLSHDRVRRPRPWTIAKWAQTLSGHLLPPEDVGDGRWISGAAARDEVQLLRAKVDAIIVGVGTVMADNPRYSVRPPAQVSGDAPARIVLDTALRTPPDARLFESCKEGEAAGPVILLCLPAVGNARREALEAVGAEVVEIRGVDRVSLHLRSVYEWLWERGFQRVLLETGPKLLRANLEEGFVDQMRVITGDVRGGRGQSLASWLVTAKLLQRKDSEVAPDSVLEAFLESR